MPILSALTILSALEIPLPNMNIHTMISFFVLFVIVFTIYGMPYNNHIINNTNIFLDNVWPLTLLLFEPAFADTSDNRLLVSADNPEFDNYFAGSMVIEVVITDFDKSDTGGGGEPHVSVNGATLRMALAKNGYWYGYFANLDAAQNADHIYRDMSGQGLDFGVFCSSATMESVFGTSFSDSDAISTPRQSGLTEFSNGKESLVACQGDMSVSSKKINNVVRSPPSLISDQNMTVGGIGLHQNAWPIVQLYSFSGNVRIQYESGGGSPQQVILKYGDNDSIFFVTDRMDEPYPAHADVILSIQDVQLNQDPTDEDAWTFGVSNDNPLVFYEAFSSNSGGDNRIPNLYPHLDSLGFDDNGYLQVDFGDVLYIRQNKNQPIDSLESGDTIYADIVTLVENRANSGLFTSLDSSNLSNLYISPDAPRGTSAVITYNDRSLSVLTGSHTASLSLSDPNTAPTFEIDTTGWRSGTRIPVTLQDHDQNTNPNARDTLDVYNSNAIIPSIRIGEPLTLSGSSNVVFYPNSGSFDDGVPISVNSFDPISSRLHLDITRSEQLSVNNSSEMVAIKMGFSATTLYSALIDTQTQSAFGTNWMNIDLRSLDMFGGVAGASLSLYFGDLHSGAPHIKITDRLNSAQDLIMINSDDVHRIENMQGDVYAVFDFGSDGLVSDTSRTLTHSNSQLYNPIVIDIFSFGIKNNIVINNAMYRLELEETTRNSGIFEGTLEFAAANQLNIDDPDFIREIRATSDNVKFVTLDKMIHTNGITITYNDLAKVGAIIPQSISSPETDITTNSGTVSVSTPSGQLRFGTPITVTLFDPDLNTSADTIEVYHTVDDPRLSSVDTVGDATSILLEVKFKDIRYKRCVIDGVTYGGLASTGFTLTETGPATGMFKGIFKMPTLICDKSGYELISTAGGSIDVIYYDARDSTGEPTRFSLLRSLHSESSVAGSTGEISGPDYIDDKTQHSDVIESDMYNDHTQNKHVDDAHTQDPYVSLSLNHVLLKDVGDTQSVVLSGNTGSNVSEYVVSVALVPPSGDVQTFDLRTNGYGKFGSKLTFQGGDDIQGLYHINVTQKDVHVGNVSLYVESVPLVIPKHTVFEWSDDTFDEMFTNVLGDLAKSDIISYDVASNTKLDVPVWLSHVVKWWSTKLISDDALVNLIQYLIDERIL